ncbi:VOC family protein [Nocardia sp. ET3-3]|uniref:VOC family protein n=1 Tax=Nocardia terrae TaxID=2675851 RepID=A0A7K1VB78_9NOCA|nr:VOC family protein [Nocardia terrae]MVU83900.1 VOC family protein [Nocardia terrae]
MPTTDKAWPQGTPCWVDCSVDDPAAARDFYSQLLGWDVLDSPPEAGGYLMAMLNGRPAAGIGPKMGDVAMPSVWTTYFAADSADAVAGSVQAAGGTVFMPPFDVMDVGRMFIAADPAGAVFGVWEAKAHTGAGIFNEPGAYCWNDLHTGSYVPSQDFYAQVFGWKFDEIGNEQMSYSTFAGADGRPMGGVGDSTGQPGADANYWLTWFQVAGTDAAAAKAKQLGASILGEPADSPFGRMAIVAGPQGEVFGLIDTTVTIG